MQHPLGFIVVGIVIALVPIINEYPIKKGGSLNKLSSCVSKKNYTIQFISGTRALKM